LTGILGNRKYRNIALQAAFVGGLALLSVSAVVITRQNIAMQGVTVGWDFLDYATGWDISFSLVPYSIDDTYARALMVGFVNTVFLGTISVTLAVLLGTVIGIARLSTHKLVNLLASSYVQLFRNIPLILQAFFWYTLVTNLPPARSAIALPGRLFISNRGFVMPALNVESVFQLIALVMLLAGAVAAAILSRKLSRLAGGAMLAAALIVAGCLLAIGKLPDLPMISLPSINGLRFSGGVVLVPELGAAIMAISLFGASYIAEIVRAGFLAVPRGLTEAGKALGLRPMDILWRIRIPMVIRIILPTLTNQIIWLMKATTIGIAIGFNDFFGVISTSITHSGQTITLILILIMGFWLINMTIAFVMNRINSAIALPGYEK